MQFPRQCKNRTDSCVSTNYSVPCRAVWASNRNFQNFGATYRHGTVFAPMQCLYCKEATGVESSKMQFLSSKTAPIGTGQQTNSCLVATYCGSNENFRNFGVTFYHATVFSPMQTLYYKEATGVESPKMQFPSQCKNRTDQHGLTNYPVSCKAVLVKQ